MAKLRKGSSYRKIERPFTRKSKYREKSYIKSIPNCLVVKFMMGATKKQFPHVVQLIAKDHIQIRHNALEAARKTANKCLSDKAGKGEFKLRIRPYPHHVLRENPLASGAGADRMSTGMKMSFGKSIGIAAQVKPGQVVAEAFVNENNITWGREAMRRFGHKLPCKTTIIAKKNPEFSA